MSDRQRYHVTRMGRPLLPGERHLLEDLATYLRPAVAGIEQDMQLERLMRSGDGVDRDRIDGTVYASPPEFRVGPDAAAALADMRRTAGAIDHLLSLPPLATFLGVPIRLDHELEPNVVSFEHPDGHREYVKVDPAGPPPTFRVQPPPARWRRFLGRCRSWRRKPRP